MDTAARSQFTWIKRHGRTKIVKYSAQFALQILWNISANRGICFCLHCVCVRESRISTTGGLYSLVRLVIAFPTQQQINTQHNKLRQTETEGRAKAQNEGKGKTCTNLWNTCSYLFNRLNWQQQQRRFFFSGARQQMAPVECVWLMHEQVYARSAMGKEQSLGRSSRQSKMQRGKEGEEDREQTSKAMRL